MKMTTASICTIGDEILIGQIIDTNSSFISRALGEIGVKTTRMLSIGDSRREIISNLRKELKTNQIVVCTGGLGPTKDDITKDALAALSGSSGYVKNEEQQKVIHRILSSRGLDVLDSNLQQAMVPDSCEVIVNRLGTAPIMVFRFGRERFGHEAVLYAMPGVPYETEAAVGDVVKDIKSHFKLEDIYHKTVMTYGLAESALAKLISDWENALPDYMHLAYLPNPLTGVRLRLSVYGGNASEMAAQAESQIEALKPILGNIMYAESDDTLEGTIGRLLRGTGKSLSCAESCTGGEIAHLITTVPGSSEYFLGSVTSYSPEVKKSVLGVKATTIEYNGIVSSAVAEAMADGVRKLTGSTYSVATTGWADSYGDEHEPAGTVWVGISGPAGTKSVRFNYKSDRKRNIERFAASAINSLRLYIVENDK